MGSYKNRTFTLKRVTGWCSMSVENDLRQHTIVLKSKQIVVTGGVSLIYLFSLLQNELITDWPCFAGFQRRCQAVRMSESSFGIHFEGSTSSIEIRSAIIETISMVKLLTFVTYLNIIIFQVAFDSVLYFYQSNGQIYRPANIPERVFSAEIEFFR